jgi:nitrogen fixation protein NifU and related proteins
MNLYHPIILQHHRKPIGFEKRLDASHIEDAYNPVCGDKYKLYLDLDQNVIQKITFHGYGCAVSKASTSILVEKMVGKTVDEALEICQSYFDLIQKGVLTDNSSLNVFEAARHFSGRLTCATLAWDAFYQFLVSYKWSLISHK